MSMKLTCPVCNRADVHQITVKLPSGALRATELFACARCRMVQYRGHIELLVPPKPEPREYPPTPEQHRHVPTLLNKLSGTDIARGSDSFGEPTKEGEVLFAIIESQHQGWVRLTYEAHKYKTHRNTRMRWRILNAEPASKPGIDQSNTSPP